jgi:hypothetical protein
VGDWWMVRSREPMANSRMVALGSTKPRFCEGIEREKSKKASRDNVFALAFWWCVCWGENAMRHSYLLQGPRPQGQAWPITTEHPWRTICASPQGVGCATRIVCLPAVWDIGDVCCWRMLDDGQVTQSAAPSDASLRPRHLQAGPLKRYHKSRGDWRCFITWRQP